MSYVLNDLYTAIAQSNKRIGRFTVSTEREYGSGSVYFSSKTGKVRQVYASPHWEIENFDAVIDGPTKSEIAYQLEGYDEITGEYVGNCGADNISFKLTGDLDADLKAYFAMLETFLPTLV